MMHSTWLAFVLSSYFTAYVVEARPLLAEILAFQGGKKLAEMYHAQNTQVQPVYVQAPTVTHVLPQVAPVYQQPFQQRSLLASPTVSQSQQVVLPAQTLVQPQSVVTPQTVVQRPQTVVQQPSHSYYATSQQVQTQPLQSVVSLPQQTYQVQPRAQVVQTQPLQRVVSVPQQTYQVQVQPQAQTIQYMPRALAAWSGRQILQPAAAVQQPQQLVQVRPQTVVHLPTTYVQEPQTVQAPNVVQPASTVVHQHQPVVQQSPVVQQPSHHYYSSSEQATPRTLPLPAQPPVQAPTVVQPASTVVHQHQPVVQQPPVVQRPSHNHYSSSEHITPRTLPLPTLPQAPLTPTRNDFRVSKNINKDLLDIPSTHLHSYSTNPQDNPDDYDRFRQYSSLLKNAPGKLSELFSPEDMERYAHWYNRLPRETVRYSQPDSPRSPIRDRPAFMNHLGMDRFKQPDSPKSLITLESFSNHPDFDKFKEYVNMRSSSPERVSEYFSPDDLERFDEWYSSFNPPESAQSPTRRVYSSKLPPSGDSSVFPKEMMDSMFSTSRPLPEQLEPFVDRLEKKQQNTLHPTQTFDENALNSLLRQPMTKVH